MRALKIHKEEMKIIKKENWLYIRIQASNSSMGIEYATPVKSQLNRDIQISQKDR